MTPPDTSDPRPASQAAVTLRQGRPFLRSAWLAAGRPASELRRRQYRQILRGVYVDRATVDPDVLVRAALLLHPASAYASRTSAAQVLGLPVPPQPFEHVTVTDASERVHRPQLKSHVTERRQRVTRRRGIRVTEPLATFIDCAGMLGLVDLVVLGDALCKKFRVSAAKLRASCRASTDYYAGLARIAAELVRDGVDSPMETRLRLLLVLAGLPEPEVNVVLLNEDGTWRRRFDLCYRRVKLVVEYDGAHHAGQHQWHSDLVRREELDEEEYRIIVVTGADFFRRPEQVVRRVRRQLVLRGWGDVPAPDDRWRDHFAA